MSRKGSFLALLIFSFTFCSQMVFVMPQSTAATISGLVRDETGGVLPGASISVLNVETGAVRTSISDDAGRYRVPLLDPGTYEVQAELVGFQTAVRSGMTLEVGGQAVVNLTLRVGEISERVVVQGEAPLVETTQTALSGLVDDKKIRDLPLNGRSFEQLALLQTGITVYRHSSQTAQNGTGTKMSIAGSRPSQNNFILDGVTINDSGNSTPGSAAGNNLGVEAIREFKVLTNTYSASYGRSSGGVISVVTKSGTNQLRGSVFAFHRNSALDAKNFFDNPNEDIPAFKRNQFGFTLGGPIVRDKTFIFGNYEGLRESLGVSFVGIVPNADARQGILPTGNVTVDPEMVHYLGFYPLPNGRDFGDGTGEFFNGPNQPTTEDYFTLRLDHQFSDKNILFVRYSFDEADIEKQEPLGVFADFSFSRYQSLAVELKTILSPTFINTVRFGGNRTFSKSDGLPVNPPGPNSLVPGQPFGGLTVGAGIRNAPISFLGSSNDRWFPYTTEAYSDDVNWTRGAHGIQIGGSVQWIQDNTAITGLNNKGGYRFDDLETLLTATSNRFSAQTPGSNRARGWRRTYFSTYIQDDFQYSPTLTFNLGFRWEHVTEIREAHGRSSQLVNLSDPAFTVGLPLFNGTGHQLQPRIGVAWDPFGDGKTAIRAGAGIFHDQYIGYFYTLSTNSLPPFNASGNVTPSDVPGGRIPFPNAIDLVTASSRPTVLRIDPEVSVPTKVHYNLNIQQELGAGTVLSVAYVGAKGTHMPRNFDANGRLFQIRPDGTKFWPAGSPRANPSFNLNLNNTADVNSFYNALQVSLNRRFSNRLQYQFSYNWSHNIDDGSQLLGSEAQSSPQNHTQPDNRKADRSHSVFDVRHNFTTNATYDLPLGTGAFLDGWQINGILSLSTGPPVTLKVGFNNSRNGDFLAPERPDLVPGADNSPVLGGPDRYYDPNSFALPEAGTLGDLARTSLVGPGFASLDFSLIKNTEIGERVNVQFRTEFFNILNRANFGLPDPTLFTPSGPRGAAGRITSTVNTSRQIQFSLKMMF